MTSFYGECSGLIEPESLIRDNYRQLLGYNTEHRHSAIKFVTPCQRHEGKDVEVLVKREQLYKQAKERNPQRWTGQTRNWERPEEVWSNPKTKTDKSDEKLKEAA